MLATKGELTYAFEVQFPSISDEALEDRSKKGRVSGIVSVWLLIKFPARCPIQVPSTTSERLDKDIHRELIASINSSYNRYYELIDKEKVTQRERERLVKEVRLQLGTLARERASERTRTTVREGRKEMNARFIPLRSGLDG